MRAAVVERPGELRIRTLSPPTPGPYQVVTEQLFGAICAATDRHLVAGKLPIPGIRYPLILGHESIGRVVELGPKVRHLKPGDLVTRTGAPETDGCLPFWGGFATAGIAHDVQAMQDDGLPEADWAPHAINRKLPPGTDPAAATMMITWRETLSYLTRLGEVKDARLLVLGSGGNGFSFLALARALGAAAVAMIGNPALEDRAVQAGASGFADYRDPEAIAGLRTVAGPRGFDLLVDAVGHSCGIEAVLALLAPGAAIGLYGIEALGERMAALREIAARGFRVQGPGDYAEAEAHDRAVAMLEAGLLDASLWFDLAHPFPLDGIADAFAAIAARQSLKALVRIAS
ncbi:MAG: alcohol dehydrogenase catalytic domain-containing protein [Sphingomonadaceae bacterium]